MTEKNPFVVTINRQLGSGADFIGKQLAENLGLLYLDREILQQAATQLNVSEDAIQSRDEAVPTFWESFMESFAIGIPEDVYRVPPNTLPTSHEIYLAESKIIKQVADRQSAVIMGRGGYYVLQDHPRRLSLFFHANSEFRLQRLKDIYHYSEPEALEMIKASDNARARYHQMVSGKEWNDARLYHLCLDTSQLGIDVSLKIILAAIKERFG